MGRSPGPFWKANQMFSKLNILRHSLISKLILAVGLTLLVSMSAWSYYAIDHQKKTAMNNIVEATERLSTTVKLGAHYAMTLNSRDDIKQIINNISKQPDIEHIRIYNKKGRIKFSNRSEEIEHRTQYPGRSLHRLSSGQAAPGRFESGSEN